MWEPGPCPENLITQGGRWVGEKMKTFVYNTHQQNIHLAQRWGAWGEVGLRCGTAHAPPDRGRSAGGEVCWGSTGSRKRRRGRRRAALGEAAQGVDSYRHGAGKHQAERWSCFNEKMLL